MFLLRIIRNDLGSTDNAGNSVNLVSGIIHLPSGLHQRPMIDSTCQLGLGSKFFPFRVEHFLGALNFIL